MKKILLLVAVMVMVVGAIFMFGCATGRDVLPLPSDVRIVIPITGLPAEIAAFSGEWPMVWDGPLEAVLIVEEIDFEKAKVTYSWGDCWAYKIRKGFSRVMAKVISNGSKVRIEWGDGNKVPKFTFEMKKGLKNLYAVREFKGRGTATVAAKKIN